LPHNRIFDKDEIMKNIQVAVQIAAQPDPQISRAFQILKDRIQQRCSVAVVEVATGAQIILALSDSLPTEAFSIESADAIRIAGGSPLGLIYGIGKFLRTSHYEDNFVPSSWRGISVPHCSLRGMYFASHFHNWYQVAPENEIIRYVEDLALWGVNTIMVCFPFINLSGWDDPEAPAAVEMVRKFARISKDLGLRYCIGVNNTLFRDAPKHLRAVRLPDPTGRRGNSGYPICPSDAEGHRYIVENFRHLLAQLNDIGLDFIMHWPYDEGGCACEACSPWGSNGFLKLSRDLSEIGQEYFPCLKTILSTWMFDTPPEGEWEGLSEAVRQNGFWVDYILADSHENFPRYPLEVGMPGDLPLLNFPEISMWGNWPWGGFGANPLPARFERLWQQVRHLAAGGFPYSEGIYEDLNKAVVVQYYWNRTRTAEETLAEYVAYEFGPAVTDDVLALIHLIETTATAVFQGLPVNIEEVRRARRLAGTVDAILPDWARLSWRWEILKWRAVLDEQRLAGPGLESPVSEAALLRLIEIFHCQIETDDPYHHRVRPPLRRAVSRNGEL
jgi:hypothetical protein